MYQGKYSNHTEPTSPAQATPETASEQAEIIRRPRVRKKRKSKKGTYIFYGIYGAFVAAFIITILCILPALQDWLVKYEASQPETKAEEVFNQLFADPDWADLYARAGIEDTVFENADTYATYMKAKVGTNQLTYIETSAGLSGDHKYIVRLGDEKVATFRLTGGTDSETEIATWELSTVEVFFDREQSVLIEKLPGHTVYINGIALDENYTIRTVTTKAEGYLPEGLHGYRMEQQYVTGLLSAPAVSVVDEAGKGVNVTRDPETGIYKAEMPISPEITEEERELAIGAAKADAQYSIRAISQANLRKYFDSKAQVYTDIITTHPFLQSYKGYTFVEDKTEIVSFYRYSDELFSVNVKLQMNVTRSNNTIKEIPVDKTYFFTLQSSGKYLVTKYTNEHLDETIEQVRLTYMNGEELIDSQMVDSDAHSLTLPKVTAPEGKVFKGWAKRDTDEKGKVTMTIVFEPTEDGTVQVGQTLEPMTLYAVFDVQQKEA